MFGRTQYSRWKTATLLIGVVGLAILIGWYVHKARLAAMEVQHAAAMDSVFTALSNYNDTEGHLPAAVNIDSHGGPLSSWRFAVTPLLDSSFVDMHFEAKWDDPVNSRWAQMAPTGYCLSKEAQTLRETSITAITGPGTAFDPAQPARLQDLPPDTILLTEMVDSGIHWMEPGDVSIDNVPAGLPLGLNGVGVHVGFADGLVWFLRPEVPAEVLKQFMTIEGARSNDRDVLLRPYLLHEYEGYVHRWERTQAGNSESRGAELEQ